MDPHTSPTPDAVLVARMAQGDLRAVQRLCQRYGSALYALAYNVLVDPDRATEVVADTFQRAWRTGAAFDAAQSTVLDWLTGIARSRLQDALHERTYPRRPALDRTAASSSPEERRP